MASQPPSEMHSKSPRPLRRCTLRRPGCYYRFVIERKGLKWKRKNQATSPGIWGLVWQCGHTRVFVSPTDGSSCVGSKPQLGGGGLPWHHLVSGRGVESPSCSLLERAVSSWSSSPNARIPHPEPAWQHGHCLHIRPCSPASSRWHCQQNA